MVHLKKLLLYTAIYVLYNICRNCCFLEIHHVSDICTVRASEMCQPNQQRTLNKLPLSSDAEILLPAAQPAGHRMGRIVPLPLLLLLLVLQASSYIIENWLEVRLPST